MFEDKPQTAEEYRSENVDCSTEEGPIAEFESWLESQLEDADPLPTPEEAELGELARVPSGQFDHCELVDDSTPDLLGFLTGGEN